LISTGDVKKGVIIELDGQLMKVLDWSHIKMARGSAQVRMKMQNVRKGDIVERTFQAGTRWPRARVETREAQYLYSDGDAFHFMDSQTYDQLAIPEDSVKESLKWIMPNEEIELLYVDESPSDIQVPLFVNEGDVLRIDTRTGEYMTRVQ
jgi:elongation factor P